jgi:UDP-hydrolysing UDP-N-acetyl-D-glucosamine 2-epimerase
MAGDEPADMVTTMSGLAAQLANYWRNDPPDVVVTIGDRYETLATATAAAFMNIPLAHIQGGEVTGTIDERVRHAVTKLADLHFVATKKARDNVIAMGEDPLRVFWTGCPSIDLAASIEGKPDASVFRGFGAKFDLNEMYSIVMYHPVTTRPAETRHDLEFLKQVVEITGRPAFWFWPNQDAGREVIAKVLRTSDLPNVHFIKNLPPEDFLRLLKYAGGIIGNSSCGLREAGYYGVPAIDVGSRQAGRERGPNVIHITNMDDIKSVVAKPSYLYGNGTAGKQIAEVLMTHENLWHEKKLTY